MPDLWKALGDVYGDADERPVPVELPASQRVEGFRTSLPLDDDLAAALSAALVDGTVTEPPAAPVAPAPPVVAAAPMPQPVAPVAPPMSAPVAPVAAPPATPAPAPVPAPVMPVAAVPAAPVPVPELDELPDGNAAERISSWLADLEHRQQLREQGVPAAAIAAVSQAWQRSDDDILPTAVAKRRDRKDRPGRGRKNQPAAAG